MDTDPFNGCQTVTGIMSIHIISGGYDGVKVRKYGSFSKRVSQTLLSIGSIPIQHKKVKCP